MVYIGMMFIKKEQNENVFKQKEAVEKWAAGHVFCYLLVF